MSVQLKQHDLYFRCLGDFELVTGEALRIDTPRKAGREFLEYLVVHPRSTISRETLIDTLWPEADLETGSHRLHVAVSGARGVLRRLVPDLNPFHCTSTGYGWHRDIVVRSDIERFERCYSNGSLDAFGEGVDLYSGDFLAGETGDWIVRFRLDLASKFVTMLEALALAAYTRGDYADAVHHASRLVTVDQGHEDATRLIMRSFAKMGQRTFALAEYALLRSHLKRYLGVEPASETNTLRQRIARGEAE
jgi:DNA-binding SARP family transcriptional activator